jgi:hypothetical protein
VLQQKLSFSEDRCAKFTFHFSSRIEILKDSVQRKQRRVARGVLSMGMGLGLQRWALFCHFSQLFLSIFSISASGQYCPIYG